MNGSDKAPKKERKAGKSLFGKRDKNAKPRERESMVTYRVYDEDKEFEELDEFVRNLEENKGDDH